ncbi:MAG: hypothetical protein NZM12_06645 [Steroidobacteraceae bacterium]|nr:hypothetical protein [Steroidobacteraceae bacterium]MDW8260420.1 hypothetical protein [Gammaproteobacteria bacterium]
MLAALYRRHGPPLETIEPVPHEPGVPGADAAIVSIARRRI